jgi:PAS domain S-box-containing protein
MQGHGRKVHTQREKEMTERGKTELSIHELQAAATQAQAAFQWQEAISLYSQALAQQEVPPTKAYDLVDGRATCYRQVGDFPAAEADLEALTRLARELGDTPREIQATNQQADLQVRQGRLAEAQEAADLALSLARQAADLAAQTRRKLEADCLVALGEIHERLGEWASSKEHSQQALDLYLELGNPAGEARARRQLGGVYSRIGRADEGQAQLERALELYCHLEDREGEGNTLNQLGLAASDRAQRRACYEQALAIFEALGNRERQAIMLNNLAGVYKWLGLYRQAQEYAEQAVQIAREAEKGLILLYSLGSLGEAFLGLGDTKRAASLLFEARALAQEVGDRWVEAVYWLDLGRVALAAGEPFKAVDHFHESARMFGELEALEEATALAWLGAAYLAQDKREAARKVTAQAVALVKAAGTAGREYPPQEVWWRRYEALADDEGVQNEAWQALERAREEMLDGIVSLSDEGLRRNYFNKVETNQEIIEAWVQQATRRGFPLSPLRDRLSGAVNVEDQLKRMLAIGVRLNARGEIRDLPGFVMNGIVELSGAERAALILLEDQGGRHVSLHSFGFSASSQEAILEEITPFLDEAARIRQGILRYHEDGPLLEQRSVLCVPLVAQGQLVGFIYVDLRGMFGRFSLHDRDLLTVLANQAAVAVENANWGRRLELRVEERTSELQAANIRLEQRNAELTIVSAVGQGLARQLDLQAIIDLVGDRIHETLGADATTIALYDRQIAGLQVGYSVAGRAGAEVEGATLGPGLTSLTSRVLETRQPIVWGTEQEAKELGISAPSSDLEEPEQEWFESYLGMPILMGEEVTGVVAVSSYRQQAYAESDVRLLSTITANMGVALENARLFRHVHNQARQLQLLQEVSQKISSILVTERLLQEVIHAVVTAFGYEHALIFLVDESTQELYVGAQIGYPDGISGLRMKANGSGIAAAAAANREAVVVPDVTHAPRYIETIPSVRSELAVPLLLGGKVIGVLNLESDQLNAFGEDDARLMTALAQQVSVALENARLFAETKRLLEESRQHTVELETVNRISQALASELELEALIQLVGEQMRQTFDADVVYVALLDPESSRIHFPYQFGEEYSTLTLGEGLTSEILQSGQPLLINENVVGRYAELGIEQVGVPSLSYLGVPITAGQQTIGVISVQSTQQEGRFHEPDVRLLGTMAAPVGIAIQNARLFAEVQNQKQLSEALVQNSPVAIVVVNLDHEVTLWNPAAERLFGYTASEAIGHDVDELIAQSASLRGEAATYSQQASGGDVVHAITRRTRKDGSRVDVELLAVPLMVEEQRVGALAIYHDITEIKRAEEAIRESERKLSDIISFLPDPTLVIDCEGRIIAWNRAIEELTGAKAQEMLGKGDYEYALPFYGERRPILIDLVLLPQEEFEERYAHIERQGSILIGETYVPHLKGGGVYLVATASALRDSKGNVVGAIETIRDITDRKQAEEELELAKAAAEAANQAKSAFLAMMSHEIRTPMNAVIGMSGLLLDTELTAEQRDFAETIRTSGDALLTIINDILDFSKIEAGRIELERQPLDLRGCVESALDLVASKAAEKGLELGCLIDDPVPQAIAGDVTRLRQILVNLLSNAVKFTDQGEIVVSVSATEKKPEFYELHFSVRDTGLGIPPDRMDRLFRSFSQVDVSTTRRYGGTGLGLAISKRLAELMDGTIWVESEGIPGQGSTFHFTIQAREAPAPLRAYLLTEQVDLRGKQVLIVDDNATNRRILSMQTQAWGMLPRVTESPLEALAWVRQGDRFDLALIDRKMSEMDGLTLAKEIRTLTSRLPLVLVSSLGQREANEEGSVFDAILLKPLKASQLYNTLIGILAAEAPPTPRVESGARPQFDPDMGRQLPLRILLAEDNAVNQKLALRLLERLGYRADVAANGLEALASLQRQTYDVVLMDVQMPEMDGLEATRAICEEWPPAQRPRIIAMTANVMIEDREACLAAGMDDYLGKPIRVDELIHALSQCQPRAERPGPHAAEETPATEEGGVGDVLDPAALQKLQDITGGDLTFLAELIDTFFEEAPQLLAQMQQALEQGDAGLLRRAAHSLKSNSAGFGAMALSSLCRELEEMGKSGSVEGAGEKVAEAEKKYEPVRAALEAIYREL